MSIQSKIINLKSKIRLYWPLIKALQTGLLLATGLAGYMSARCPIFNIGTILGLSGSLFLAISGSTVLNMWWDRDIDAKMGRTRNALLQQEKLSPGRNPAPGFGFIGHWRGLGCCHEHPLWTRGVRRIVLRRSGVQHVAQAPHLLGYRLGWGIGRHADFSRACAWRKRFRLGWYCPGAGCAVLDPYPHPDLQHEICKRL